MELLQDGVVAALAAIGVTALIWLVDCGLTDEGRRAAALLSDMNTKLLTPQELAAYYTEEDTTEQGR